jgi:hypothetical protein
MQTTADASPPEVFDSKEARISLPVLQEFTMETTEKQIKITRTLQFRY